MPTESKEASQAKRQYRPTRMSPGLQADLRRLRGIVPAVAVLLVIGVVLALGYYAAGVLIAPQASWAKPFGKPSQFGLSPKEVRFDSQDGMHLRAWWERPWTVVNPKGTVIVVHGLQMNKTGMAYISGKLLARGYNVLIPDLRGHGGSTGWYATFGYKEKLDVQAAIRWARRQEPRAPIALLGYSTGAVAALYAAADDPEVAAVVADSAFLDVVDVLDRESSYLGHAPAGAKIALSHRARLWLLTAPGMRVVAQWMFRVRAGVSLQPPQGDLLTAVGRIRSPRVLYLRSAGDPVVPPEVTTKLLEATGTANKQLVVTKGQFHSAIAGSPTRYIEAVSGFLDGATAIHP